MGPPMTRSQLIFDSYVRAAAELPSAADDILLKPQLAEAKGPGL